MIDHTPEEDEAFSAMEQSSIRKEIISNPSKETKLLLEVALLRGPNTKIELSGSTPTEISTQILNQSSMVVGVRHWHSDFGGWATFVLG